MAITEMRNFFATPLSSRTSTQLAGLAIALLVIGLYGPFINSPPIFDDLYFFVDPLAYAGHLTWSDLLSSRWIWLGSLELSYWLWGVNPRAYHGGNLLLHALTAFSLFLFIRGLLKFERGANANLPAFVAAALFAMHPVSAFAVGYITQRSIVLASLFSVWMWIAVHHGVAQKSKLWLLGSVVFYFLAVFSKEHAVTALPVAVLIAWNASGGSIRKTLSALALPLPFWVMTAFAIAISKKDLIGKAYEPLLNATGAILLNKDDLILRSYLNQCWMFFKYVAYWLFPNGSWMAIDMREPFPTTWYAWPWILGLLAFLAYPLLVLIGLWRGFLTRIAAIALISPWLLFLTMFGAAMYQESFVLYRSYLWALPATLLVAVLLSKTTTKGQVVAFTVAGALLFALTWKRLQILSEPLVVWNEAVERLKGNDGLPFVYRIYHNRGIAYASRRDRVNLELAIADYSKALALDPVNFEVRSDRGVAYFHLHDYAKARLDFEFALDLKPRYRMALRGRGLSLINLGERERGLADLATACHELQFGCDLYQYELYRPTPSK